MCLRWVRLHINQYTCRFHFDVDSKRNYFTFIDKSTFDKFYSVNDTLSENYWEYDNYTLANKKKNAPILECPSENLKFILS